jgi:hypothetical protein
MAPRHDVLPPEVIPIMHALFIDPDHRTVEVIQVEHEEVSGLLHTQHTVSVDLDADHCLVIDDAEQRVERTARFRFGKGPVERPFFGPGLVLGLKHGNWASATVDADAFTALILWETWDIQEERYVPVEKNATEKPRTVKGRARGPVVDPAG